MLLTIPITSVRAPVLEHVAAEPERHRSRRELRDEPPVPLDGAAVEQQLAAAAQVADQVPVQRRDVGAAGLRVARAEREVDRAADLLVEQGAPGEPRQRVVGADADLAQPARAGVDGERRVEHVLAVVGVRLDHTPRSNASRTPSMRRPA